MESYAVLARKWRPTQFKDIVGQNHIVRTLSNAITNERLHHAYLFTGSRGLGKTSIARIFAKAIRCPNRKVEELPDGGKTIRSCNECSDCREINSSRSVDVLEIDGASNNGVDAVRDLRESIQYHPATGTKKVILIDEVHMLTTAAFNALLKTLEEPPPHALFILATTEPHKIPSTILSRCQRFDFKRASPVQIQSLLKEILSAEKITADDAVLTLLSQAAEGSFRDALSLLDQAISYCGGKLTVELVRECVGFLPIEMTLLCLEGIFRRDVKLALAQADEAYAKGADLRVFVRSLLEFLHASILLRSGAFDPVKDRNPTALAKPELEALSKMIGARELEEMELIFQVFHHGLDWMARSPQPKHILDILIVKAAMGEALIQVSDLKSSGSETKTKESVTPSSFSPPPSRILSGAASVQTFSEMRLMQTVKEERPHLGVLLEYASEMRWEPSTEPKKKGILTVVFGPKQAVKIQQIQSKPYLDAFYRAVGKLLGPLVDIRLIEKQDAKESVREREERLHTEKLETRKNDILSHPIIEEARTLFGGTMGPVELIDDDQSRQRDP